MNRLKREQLLYVQNRAWEGEEQPFWEQFVRYSLANAPLCGPILGFKTRKVYWSRLCRRP